MNSKRIIWILAAIGGLIGGYVPALWGAGGFTFSTLFFNAIGAFVGIWIGYKITR